MSIYNQGPGTYRAVGEPAGSETKTGPGGAPDPATIAPPSCPLDGTACRVVGSQSNPWRCQQGHQWAMVGASDPVVSGIYYLVSAPYVFVGILAPVVPFSPVGTLG